MPEQRNDRPDLSPSDLPPSILEPLTPAQKTVSIQVNVVDGKVMIQFAETVNHVLLDRASALRLAEVLATFAGELP